MAQIMLQDAFRKAGMKHVEVVSTGVSDEESGNPIDHRAARTLTKHGFKAGDKHRARSVSARDLRQADLVLPMTAYHARALSQLANADGDKPVIRMLRSFDPDAPKVPDQADEYLLDVEDPWYGGEENFEECFAQLQTAIPGIVEYVKQQTAKH